MGRPPGSKNAGHDERRRELAQAVIPALTREDGAECSLRELAREAGVSPPTLRHYFSDRDGIIIAAFEEMLAMGAPHIKRSAEANLGPLDASMRWYAASLVHAWGIGVGRLIAAGLSLGLLSVQRGPAFINNLLEPTLQAVETRLGHHQARGELVEGELRQIALSFSAPLILALLHQQDLGGAGCRPLDIDAFLDAHIRGFLRAYAREG